MSIVGTTAFDRGYDGFRCLLQRTSMLRLNSLQLSNLRTNALAHVDDVMDAQKIAAKMDLGISLVKQTGVVAKRFLQLGCDSRLSTGGLRQS